MNHEHSEGQGSNHPTRSSMVSNWLICGLALIAAYFVLTEHWAHVLPFLPYALLMVCPVMHLFMHRHHGHGKHHDGSAPPRAPGSPSVSGQNERRP